MVLAAPLALRVTADGTGLMLGTWRIPETCAVLLATGRQCPTCHLGRSIVALVHGDVAGSLRHHTGGVLLVGWAVLQALARLVLAWRAPDVRYWWADLSVSAVSLTAVEVIVARGGL